MQPGEETPAPAAPGTIAETLVWSRTRFTGRDRGPGIPNNGHYRSRCTPACPLHRCESGRPASRFARLLSKGAASAASAGQSSAEIPIRKVQGSPAVRTARQPQPAQPYRRPVDSPVPAVCAPGEAHRSFRLRTLGRRPPRNQTPRFAPSQGFFGGLVRIIQGVRAGSQRISAGLPEIPPQPSAQFRRGF